MTLGKFENSKTETDVQQNSQNEELNSQFEAVLDDDEIDYLNQNTADSSESSSTVSIADYTDEELKELYDDFAGYTNGDVRYENSGKNIEDASFPREYSEEYKKQDFIVLVGAKIHLMVQNKR